MGIGAGQSAEIGAFAGALAGHEEGHIGLLRDSGRKSAACYENRGERCV
jgi:hypothetical protein